MPESFTRRHIGNGIQRIDRTGVGGARGGKHHERFQAIATVPFNGMLQGIDSHAVVAVDVDGSHAVMGYAGQPRRLGDAVMGLR